MSTDLFSLPTPSVDWTAITAFLGQRIREGLNVEYKETLTTRVLESIAAMANTYGGLIFIGVAEDGEFPTWPPVGVHPDDRDRLVNQCHAQLVPPFPFDVVSIDLPNSDRIVLMVRIDSRRAERPVVLTSRDNHRYLIRLDRRNAPADRYRLASLFDETRGSVLARSIPSDWSPTTGAYVHLEGELPALLFRASIEASIPPDRLDRALVDTTTRDELRRSLSASSIDAWLRNRTDRWTSSGGMDAWTREGLNLSWVATQRWRAYFPTQEARRTPWSGQAVLALPAGFRDASEKIALLVDHMYQPGLADGMRPGHPRHLGLDDLYFTMRSLLAGVVEASNAPFRRVLGIDAWDIVGPTLYLQSQGDMTIANFLILSRFNVSQSDHLSAMTFPVPRDAVLGTNESIGSVVKEWMTRLLLDSGVGGFEGDVQAL